MMQPDPAPHGTPEAYRQYIAEMLNAARIQAELGCTFAAIGDDVGLGYSVLRLVAYTKAAFATLNDLKTMKGGSHADAA